MLQGLVIAVVVLGGVVAVLSFGFILHASRLTNAEEAVSAAAGRLEACGAAIRRLEADVAHQDDVIKGLAGQIKTLCETRKPILPFRGDASLSLQTKIFGD